MINVKDQVYDAIKGIAENVSDSHPQINATFPAIQYTEEDNSVVEWSDGKEQKAHLLYRIDIWDRENTSELTLQVDNAISQLGLQRKVCGDVADPNGFKHKLMRYEGIIDVNTEMVYQ